MKITKSQLRQIIKEELNNIVNEDEGAQMRLPGGLGRRSPEEVEAWRQERYTPEEIELLDLLKKAKAEDATIMDKVKSWLALAVEPAAFSGDAWRGKE